MKLSREVKTGFIAVVVLALTIWGFNFLKGKNIMSPTDVFYVEYEQIEGLIESGAVYYKGFKVGSINDIFFDTQKPDNFIVKIVLEKDLKIPINTRVMAKESNPIAGAKDLHLLFYDTTAYHKPGDTLLPTYDAGLLGFLAPLQSQLDETITSLNTTLAGINTILSEDTQADISKSLNNIKNLTGSLAYQMSNNGPLGQTLSNVESISTTIDGKKEELGKAIENFASISASLDSANLQKTFATLDSTLIQTESLMTKINEGEGTMGLMLNDSALYNNLAASTASLDSLLTDLKDHPKRYVHFSLFGKKDKEQ